MSHNKTLQELKEKLALASPEKHATILYELGYNNLNISTSVATDYAERSLAQALLFDNRYDIARGTKLLGIIDSMKGLYAPASNALNSAKQLFEELNAQSDIAHVYNTLSLLEIDSGNYVKALSHQLEAIRINEELGNFVDLVLNYSNLGLLHEDRNALDQALVYQKKALEIAQSQNDRLGIAYQEGYIAQLMLKRGETQNAIQHAQTAVTLARETGDNGALSNALMTLAQLYDQIDQHQLALAALEEILVMHATIDLPREMAETLLMIGKVHISQQKFATAEDYLKQTVEVADQANVQFLAMQAYEQIYRLHKLQENYAAALEAYEKHVSLKERLFSRERDSHIAEIQARFKADQQEKEAEIYRLRNEELSHMVTQRTRELEQALDREHAALAKETELAQMKSRVIEVISHEFRTPLTVINTSTNMLKSYYHRLDDEAKSTQFARISRAIKRIIFLLDEALTMNRIESVILDMSVRETDVAGLCRKMTTARMEEHPDYTIVCDVKGNVPIIAHQDPQILQDALSQLLDNAINFSEPSEPITLTISATDNTITIDVEDKGIGIPAEELDKIFESFYRASNGRYRRGMGLGLTIAQLYTHAMEGEIEASSQGTNMGSRFRIKIPSRLPVQR